MKTATLTEGLSVLLGRIAAYLLFPLVLAVAYSSFKRYFLGSMPTWGYEVPIFLYGISFMLGGAYCLMHEKHVNVDILPKYLSPSNQKRLSVVTNVLIMISCAVIGYYAVWWAWDSTLLRERSVHQTEFNPEIWWFKWIIPISFIAIAIQALQNILNQLTRKKVSHHD